MPLIKPISTWGGKGFWTVLRRDAFFIIQRQTLPQALYPYAPYRILIASNNYSIAEAKTEDAISRDWTEVHKLVVKVEVAIAGKDAAEAGATLLRFFEGIAAVDGRTAMASSPGTTPRSDGMFAFLNDPAMNTKGSASSSAANAAAAKDPLMSLMMPPEQSPLATHDDLAAVMSPPPPPAFSNVEVQQSIQPGTEVYELANSVNSLLSSSELSAVSGDDIAMEGWVHRLKSGPPVPQFLASAAPKTWLRRFLVLWRNCLFEHDDEVVATFSLANPALEACSVTCSAYGAGAGSGSDAAESFEISSLRPTSLGPSAVGYAFEVREAASGMALFATETVGEFSKWISFISGFNGIPREEAKQLRMRGWLYACASPPQKPTATATWEKRWVEIRNGAIESHRRIEKGFVPLRGCSLDDTGLEMAIRNTAGDAVFVMKVDVSDWSRWTQEIRKAIRLSVNESESLERDEVDLRKLVADAIAEEKLAKSSNKERIAEWKALLSTSAPASAAPEGEEKKFLVLSIDGGGMRGLMTAIILERLQREFPDLLDRVDLVAGTSNGGIIACALAFGHTPSFCRAILEGTGRYIFKKPEGILAVPQNAAINTPKFSNRSLNIIAECAMGTHVLGQARKKVVIPAFLLDNGPAMSPRDRSCEARYMHNLRPLSPEENTGANTPVVDVIMRTTAAPTFFPSHEGYVDGGMFAQDPSSLALSLVLSPQRGIAKPPSDVCLLSIGTGQVRRYYEDSHNHEWGYMQWVPKMLNVLWDAMVLKSAAMCKELLGDRYHRCNPDLATEIPMDDPLQMPSLVAYAQEMDLAPTFEWVRTHVYGLPQGSTVRAPPAKSPVVAPSPTVPRMRSASSTKTSPVLQ